MEMNMNMLLQEIPNGHQYYITANGKLAHKNNNNANYQQFGATGGLYGQRQGNGGGFISQQRQNFRPPGVGPNPRPNQGYN